MWRRGMETQGWEKGKLYISWNCSDCFLLSGEQNVFDPIKPFKLRWNSEEKLGNHLYSPYLISLCCHPLSSFMKVFYVVAVNWEIWHLLVVLMNHITETSELLWPTPQKSFVLFLMPVCVGGGRCLLVCPIPSSDWESLLLWHGKR